MKRTAPSPIGSGAVDDDDVERACPPPPPRMAAPSSAMARGRGADSSKSWPAPHLGGKLLAPASATTEASISTHGQSADRTGASTSRRRRPPFNRADVMSHVPRAPWRRAARGPSSRGRRILVWPGLIWKPPSRDHHPARRTGCLKRPRFLRNEPIPWSLRRSAPQRPVREAPVVVTVSTTHFSAIAGRQSPLRCRKLLLTAILSWLENAPAQDVHASLRPRPPAHIRCASAARSRSPATSGIVDMLFRQHGTRRGRPSFLVEVMEVVREVEWLWREWAGAGGGDERLGAGGGRRTSTHLRNVSSTWGNNSSSLFAAEDRLTIR